MTALRSTLRDMLSAAGLAAVPVAAGLVIGFIVLTIKFLVS